VLNSCAKQEGQVVFAEVFESRVEVNGRIGFRVQARSINKI